jgi:hypothetical protein
MCMLAVHESVHDPATLEKDPEYYCFHCFHWA